MSGLTVAQPQSKAAENPNSKIAPKRSTGNQATLRPQMQRSQDHAKSDLNGDRKKNTPQEEALAQESTRGASWNFANTLVHPPDQTYARSSQIRALNPGPDSLRNQSGVPLEPDARRYFEWGFRHDFSQVRIHTGPAAARSAHALAAHAYTVGDDIVFNADEYASDRPASRHLLAHELAHVVQQRRGGASAPTAGDPMLEEAAQRAADAVMGGVRFTVAGATGIGIARQQQSSPAPAGRYSPPIPPPPNANMFDDPKSWSSAAEAAKAITAYQALRENERMHAVAISYKKNLRLVLASLSATDQVQTFVEPLKEIGRFVEEIATRNTAQMSDDEIAAEEAKFLTKQAADAAQAAADAAAKAKGAAPAPVTPAEVEHERRSQVAATSIPQSKTSWWASLSPADQTNWTTRGNAAIAAVVSYAAAHHPELKLTAAQFNLNFPGIEARGANVVAAGSPAMVGRAFVTSAELNPAYVMDVVVHELFGHPEYGQYGTEYGLKLYDKAAQKIPGYTKPAEGSAERTTEMDAYAYQETEIFALLRSMSYRTAPSVADAAKVPNLDTQNTVTWHVGLIKQQWAPSLVVAILRGIRKRLATDPRVSSAALGVFDIAVRQKFDAATVAAVAA